MRKLMAAAVGLVVLTGPAFAQSTGTPVALTGFVGANFRSEGGRIIDGAFFNLGVILGSRSATRLELTLGGAQMNAHSDQNISQIQSSLEGSVMAERDLLTRGSFALEGALGLVVSHSL